jgi:hypothetical protein
MSKSCASLAMAFCLVFLTPGANPQTILPGTKAFTLDGDPAAKPKWWMPSMASCFAKPQYL